MQMAKDEGLNADIEVKRQWKNSAWRRSSRHLEELEKAIIKDYGDLEEFKKDIRTRYLTQQVIEHEVDSRIIVTNEEMRKYYDDTQAGFRSSRRRSIAEITVLFTRRLPEQIAKQRKKIEEALVAVKKGDDFVGLAQKYSEVETAEERRRHGILPETSKSEVNLRTSKGNSQGAEKGRSPHRGV